MGCFVKENGTVHPFGNYAPCGPVPDNGAVHCCFDGQECLSNGFCHDTNIGAGLSGYYLGGCSDKSFPDPACPNPCGAYAKNDAVYNHFDDGMWTCCDVDKQGNPLCNQPQGVNFTAPPQKQLIAVATVVDISSASVYPSSVTAAAASSADAALLASGLTRFVSATATGQHPGTSSAGPVATPALDAGSLQQDNSVSKPLSNGAIAGIVIGVLFFLAIVVFLGVLFFRTRRRRFETMKGGYNGARGGLVPPSFPKRELPVETKAPPPAYPQELSSSQAAQEMPTSEERVGWKSAVPVELPVERGGTDPRGPT